MPLPIDPSNGQVIMCVFHPGVARSGTLADGSTVSDTTPRYGSLSSALWSLALSLSVTCGVSPLRKIYRLTLLMTAGYFRTARGKYMLWTAIGSLMMTLGFIVRIPMNNDPTSIPIYTVQTLVGETLPTAGTIALMHHSSFFCRRALSSRKTTTSCLTWRPGSRRMTAYTSVQHGSVAFSSRRTSSLSLSSWAEAAWPLLSHSPLPERR